MNISDLKRALIELAAINRVPFIEGFPGIGKSTAVKQFSQDNAKKLGLQWFEGPENLDKNKYGFLDYRSNVHDVIDLLGLPRITEEFTTYTKPLYIPADGQGVLFLDEFVQDNQSKQAALNQLVLDRRVGSHKLGDGWIIITAGNRTTDRSAVFRMPAHTSNRFIRLSIDFSIKDYIKYLTNVNAPDVSIAFAKLKSGLLESFDPKLDVNCTPRSYESAALLLEADDSIKFDMIAGCIGKGAATELVAFERVWLDLPNIELVLSDPDGTPIPSKSKPDIMFAIANMLGMNASPTTFTTMLRYLKRFDAREYMALFAQAAITKNRETLLDVPAFNDFLDDITDLMD